MREDDRWTDQEADMSESVQPCSEKMKDEEAMYTRRALSVVLCSPMGARTGCKYAMFALFYMLSTFFVLLMELCIIYY